ncbi:stage V sporulation protein R [candidate division LCP-89 bacterium B3_LCP]|uniref:Stage V sporulation protein R n=1 Tax=candidate division LCP-89 bacterium B3_LCP TaxID=2012998 RepID=A0A532V295_UNCL8|nr:MAG: stage V sporulation protein R [candidate division LCP-89 bacterium B3_LCP]
MMNYSVEDLQKWDEKILAKVEEFGLDPFPQHFEICDHFQMLGYMSYSGMPSRYPHWSFGKAYEKQKTLYDYGVSGLPYEMVINSNPSLAYLMRDNSLLLQILTIAHVYAHNDFFKNNFTFRHSNNQYTIEKFKTHADRVRDYVEAPGIGQTKVDEILDAAHALSLQCRRNLEIRKLNREEQEDLAWERSQPRYDPYQAIHKREEWKPPDTSRVPLEPDEDLLLFIRDHNFNLSEWEKDLLTIIHQETQYFLPQIETKIMNEGWASFWHKRILDSLELPQELHIEFMVRHNQVLRPTPGQINPYHLGYRIYEDIESRWDDPTDEEKTESGRKNGEGREKIFQVRKIDRDSSFLRQYLTEELVRDMDLFRHEKQGNDRVVSEIADEDNWEKIKQTLIKQVGTTSIPVIKIFDSDHLGERTLYLKHDYDGRELDLEYAEKTIAYAQQLWGHPVMLETLLDDKEHHLVHDGQQFKTVKAG